MKTHSAKTLKNKKLCLAGASGLVGTGLIRHILACYPSLSIRGIYHGIPPTIRNRRVQYMEADLTKRTDARKAMRGCDVAILAAANTGGASSALSQPNHQVTDNLVIDALTLEAAYNEGVKRLVFVSSAVVYQELPRAIKESQLDLNQDPHPAYMGIGWVKRATEKLCRFWHDKYGLEIIIVRAANIYGPCSVFNPSRSNFIPALIRKAADRMDPFEVWGRPDVVRDIIYVDDFARAVMMLLATSRIDFDVFNLGSGRGASVRSVVSSVLKHAGHKPRKIVYLNKGPSTIGRRVLDCSKIKRAIGWAPDVSMDSGLQQTVQWWNDNKTWWKR
jgi:nucleoside-diphosphate-sugar epimerase